MVVLWSTGGGGGGGGGGFGGIGLSTQDIARLFARPTRRVRYLIYDGLDTIVPAGRYDPPSVSSAGHIAEWLDATLPEFDVAIPGGAGDLTVTLPRRYGSMGEADEDSIYAPTLVQGYRVDVLVATEDTLAGGDSSLSWELVYRGTIEDWGAALGGGVAVTVRSLTRVAEQTMKPEPWSIAANSPMDAAKKVVDTYLPGLAWDPDNDTPVTGTTTVFPFQPGSVMDALRHLTSQEPLDDAFVYITPQGTVRWWVATRTATGFGRGGEAAGVPDGAYRHLLRVNHEITHGTLGKSNQRRVKKVWVISPNGVGSATAVDYDANDPREITVTDPTAVSLLGFTDKTVANERAAYYLRQWDRLQLNGEVVVPADRYPIELFRVGDAVRVVPDRMLGTNDYEGANDYSSVDVYIMGLHYSVYGATLAFDQPPPDVLRQVETRLTQAEWFIQTFGSLLWQQGAALAIKGGVIVSGDTGGHAATVEPTNDISGDDFKVWVNGTARKLVTAAWP